MMCVDVKNLLEIVRRVQAWMNDEWLGDWYERSCLVVDGRKECLVFRMKSRSKFWYSRVSSAPCCHSLCALTLIDPIQSDFVCLLAALVGLNLPLSERGGASGLVTW